MTARGYQFDLNGKRYESLRALAQAVQINYATLHRRVVIRKMDIEQAVRMPAKKAGG